MSSWVRLSLFALLIWLPAYGSAEQDREPSRWLTVWAGMLPIIVAAPHGGRIAVPGIAARRGLGVAQFSSGTDSNTAELAELLALKLEQRLRDKPFLVIAHFARKYVDANRARTEAYETASARPYYDAYHGALAEASETVRRRWGSGLLLDIHGQGAEPDTIFRGTHNGKSISALRRRFGAAAVTGPKSILAQMALKGYRVAPSDDHERRYTGGYTTQTYGSHRGTEVDAIQLEFGANLRKQARVEQTANDLAQAIETFAQQFLPLTKASGEQPRLEQR